MVYEYPTNYSNGTIVDGPGKFFLDYPTSVISQYSNGLILLIFMFVFAATSFSGVKKSLTTTCFITGLISVYFVVGGWASPVIPIALLIFGIVGALGSQTEM